MKYQILFSKNNKKIISKGHLKFLSSMQSDKAYFVYFFQGFRAAAEQQIEVGKRNNTNSTVDLESLRKAAMIIFNQYLSEKVGYYNKHVADRNSEVFICKKVPSNIRKMRSASCICAKYLPDL